MNAANPPSERFRWGLFIAFVLVSIALLVLDVTGHLSVVVGYVRTPFAAVQDWISGRVDSVESTIEAPLDVGALQAENKQLRERLAELERQNEELVEIYAEYTLLSALLDYDRSSPEYRRVAADVIGWEISNLSRVLTINKGERDGILAGMPVETERGLVGRVIQVAPFSAQVQLLTDPGSAVNVRLGASRATGVIEGQLSNTLLMKWIEQDITISENELVMTSGLGGNFPPDLVIGRVVKVWQSTSELFQVADVRPAADLSQLEIVQVIVSFEPVNVTDEAAGDE
jgi:rod shape-determining protein MreC